MTRVVQKRVKRLYAQLLQGKPVPAFVEVAPDEFRCLNDLLRELGIRAPKGRMEFTTKPIK